LKNIYDAFKSFCGCSHQAAKTFAAPLYALYKYLYIYRMSQGEWLKLREGVPYVKLYRKNPKHLYPKLNGYGDIGH
jgi:hypothetical protein